MPRNGSGIFNLPPSNPVVPGTVIESDWANDTMADLANALSQSIAYDGQTVPIADLPMGTFRHINVGNPTSRNQYATLGMVQDGNHQRVQILSGVDNLNGTLVGGATAYVPGAIISWFSPATNTGSVTMNYNGIGARSVVDANGLPLAAGDVQAGDFLTAIYTGTEFRLITAIDSTQAADLYNLSITGQVRPPSDAYLQMSIASATSINIPAGEAWIVPPGNDADESTHVTWNAQSITLQFLNTSFTTFIVVDVNGNIQQIPGRAVGANFRNYAVLGVVEHITGVANQVITRPAVFGDDGYRARDQASLLANTVINGGIVIPNSVSGLQLDVAQGTIFIPGGSANTPDAPNTYNIPPQQNIQFRTLAGTNTVSAVTQTVPVGSYDANGAGVVAALPNPGDATVHRLYFLYGQYILAYGQQVYSSIENALSFIEWDRTKFKKSLYLADATLMAEVVAIRTATNLNLIAQGAVVCPGGLNFSIGSPGGIAEAPIDGFPYGRKNAAWSRVLEAVSPTITNDANISGPAPKLRETLTPVGASTSGWEVFSGAFKWYAEEVVNPDDKVYFRSYNPNTGALRFTTTYDLATGVWDFPSTPTMGGVFPVPGGTAGIVGINTTTVLSLSSHANRSLVFNSASAITITLPTAVGRNGTRINMLNIGAGVVTVQRNGAENINLAGVNVTSLTMQQGDYLTFETFGASPWYVSAPYSQQSQVDEAAPRVLKVGAFGRNGGVAVPQVGAFDANAARPTGTYTVEPGVGTVTNMPDNTAGWILEQNNFTFGAASETQQVAHRRNGVDEYVRNRQAPSTWTTWKRRLQQGDFGVGATANSNITDANTLLTGGLYSTGNTWTGSPYAGGDNRNFGTLLVQAWADSTAATQTFISVNADVMFIRRRSGSVWSGWIPIQAGFSGYNSFVLQNSFFDADAFRYSKTGNIVIIQGKVGRAGGWPALTTIANIPVGYRPASFVGCSCQVGFANFSSQINSIGVSPNGDIACGIAANIGTPDSSNGTAVVNIMYPAA